MLQALERASACHSGLKEWVVQRRLSAGWLSALSAARRCSSLVVTTLLPPGFPAVPPSSLFCQTNPPRQPTPSTPQHAWYRADETLTAQPTQPSPASEADDRTNGGDDEDKHDAMTQAATDEAGIESDSWPDESDEHDDSSFQTATWRRWTAGGAGAWAFDFAGHGLTDRQAPAAGTQSGLWQRHSASASMGYAWDGLGIMDRGWADGLVGCFFCFSTAPLSDPLSDAQRGRPFIHRPSGRPSVALCSTWPPPPNRPIMPIAPRRLRHGPSLGPSIHSSSSIQHLWPPSALSTPSFVPRGTSGFFFLSLAVAPIPNRNQPSARWHPETRASPLIPLLLTSSSIHPGDASSPAHPQRAHALHGSTVSRQPSQHQIQNHATRKPVHVRSSCYGLGRGDAMSRHDGQFFNPFAEDVRLCGFFHFSCPLCES